MASAQPTYPSFDCAIHYTSLDTPDYFRKESSGWFLGRMKSDRAVEFLDFSADNNIPSDATIVPLNKSSPNNYSSTNNDVIVTPNDKGVEAGDQVFCFFQHGQGVEAPAWFRGRVAKVNDGTIDVAYDDGEYEYGVPIEYSIRMTHAERQLEWMQGVEVKIPGKSRQKGALLKASSGVVVSTNGTVQLEFKCKGDTWTKKKPYKEVLHAILRNCAALASVQRKWPAVITPQKPAPAAAGVVEKKKRTTAQTKKVPLPVAEARDSKKRTTTANKTLAIKERTVLPTLESNENSTTRSQVPKSKKRTAVPSQSQLSKKQKPLQTLFNSRPKRIEPPKETRPKDDEPFVLEVDETYVTPPAPTRSRRTTARQAAMKIAKLKIPSCDVPAIPEGTTRRLPSLPAPLGLGVATGYLPISESYTYGDALVSSDSLMGSDWLNFLARQRGLMPNLYLWEKLTDFLTHGPRSNGNIFPDISKMTTVLEYVEMIVEKTGLDLSEPLWKGDICEAILEQTKSILYGDIVYRNDTIHAKMCAARVLRHILEGALTESVQNNEDPTDKLRKLGFTKPAKVYFESAVEALASTSSGLDAEGEIFTLRCDLGSCTSFLAWWYGISMNENADALADIIALTHPPQLGLLNQLDRSLVPQVRPKVAERWGLTEEYNLIYA